MSIMTRNCWGSEVEEIRDFAAKQSDFVLLSCDVVNL